MPGPDKRVAVIGAGMTGLVVTSQLRTAGCDVVTVDKGRGLGGRCATRRRDGLMFDHGAQYLSVNEHEDAFLADLMRDAEANGRVAEWTNFGGSGLAEGGPRTEGRVRYVGLPGMSGLARILPGHEEVENGFEVDRLERVDGRWSLVSNDGDMRTGFDRVIVTAPAPQAHRLVAPHIDAFQGVADVVLTPNWTGLFAFDAPLPLEKNRLREVNETIGWAVRENAKPGRTHLDAECWTVQATAAWSRTHLEREKADIAEELLTALRGLVDAPLPTVRYSDAHRWRYAYAERPLGVASIYDTATGLAVAGDWCLGSRLNHAVASALDVVSRVSGHQD